MRVPWSPRNGAFVVVTLTGPSGSLTLPGLIDSGAEDVLLDQAGLQKLGLIPTGHAAIETAAGEYSELLYQARLRMVGRDLGLLPVVALGVGGETRLLLGRSALRYFRLLFDGAAGYLEIS